MKLQIMKLAVMALCILVALAQPGRAGTLDDYYLQQFGENSASLLKSIPASVADLGHAGCGMPLKKGLQRDWDKLDPATQKVLAKQLAAPVLENEATLTSANFVLHYATTGTDAPTPGFPYTLATWVQQVSDTFEQTRAIYQNTYGYRSPPVAPYHVYLRSLAALKIYGQTTTEAAVPSAGFPNAYSSNIEIDKDFTDPIYTRSPVRFTPLQSLQITAAHEFHHAIQFGYSILFDVWYAEATSTWYEDELYDGVNQLYNYIPGWFNNSARSLDNFIFPPGDTSQNTALGYGYGRWIFNRYLAEQHGSDMIRLVWEKLAPISSSSDIPMVPIIDSVLSTSFSGSLAADFFGFTKRVYTRDWATHTGDTILIHPYAPVGTFNSFPVTAAGTPLPFVTLPHYSFAYYKFTPTAAVANLTIFINKTSGIQTALFRKSGGIISEITAAGVGSYTVNGFGLLNPVTDEVVLLISNTANADNHQAAFSTSGTPATVTEPPATPPTTPTTTPPTTPTASSGGGGGGSCFIATAAYGSYLHPQVQVLRDFRDEHLLTNAPGRAFVALYYRFSPPVADFIAQHAVLRLLMRLLLTPVVLAVVHPGATGLVVLAFAGCIAGRMRWRKSDSQVHQDQAV